MIAIRACSGLEELEACVQLQVETCGYDVAEVVPRKVFLVAQKIGGQVIGAFDAALAGASKDGGPESLVGFAMAWPGVKTGHGAPLPYLHSHMLAVRKNYRNQGLGARLKLEQRRDALQRGIGRMEWTFDPLEIKNAFLNIHKLGATASRYEVDFYGVSSSRLQSGLPTDRLVAEWQLDSPRVEDLVAGRPPAPHAFEECIQVPASIYQWRASESGLKHALDVQLENRRKFQQAFSQGLAVLGFTRDAEGNGVFELGLKPQAEPADHPKDHKNL